MNTNVPERLAALRGWMRTNNLDACMIPSADPHQSEYTADCWKFRAYLSGFTGSSGRLVVGLEQAGLWTDSRYFLQAEEELKHTGIELFKSNLPETISPEEWIVSMSCRSAGIDGSVFCASEALYLEEFFRKKGIALRTDIQPYSEVWPERPARPADKIYVFPDSRSGEPVRSKLARLRSEMARMEADLLPLTMLDEIAWLFNLRGSDVTYNPVGVCYACVEMEQACLFTDACKIDKDTSTYLAANDICLKPYEDLPAYIAEKKNLVVLVDRNKINHYLFRSIPDTSRWVEGPSPVTTMKGIKNEAELAGFRKAMIKDGIALIQFRMWLEEQLQQKGSLLNEYMVAEKIAWFRSRQSGYVCDSFAPIVSYNDHGAVVHYEPDAASAYPLREEGILLIDTGGQYLDGTTDITRTFILGGDAPDLFREDYTSLLKGVIALSSAVFPEGTRGVQLDALARQFIWKRNLNFLHGTGHGVGHFLNVHEGPQSIRMNENPTTLKPGMILTNEPGIYRTGEWGVRIENMMLVREQETSEFGSYLCFETLTLFPLEQACIRTDLLTPAEIDWVNQYHQRVYRELSPSLSDSEKAWLRSKTDKLS